MKLPDGYAVSSNGVVTDSAGKVLKQYKENNGYLRVYIKQDGKRKKVSVHRLVAETYLANPENKPCVNHKDGNKENNCVENLEWCTHSENELHSHRKLGKQTSQENLQKMIDAHVKTVSAPVFQMDLHGRYVNTFRSMAEAARVTGISQGNISQCCNNKRNKAGGYKWSFAI